MKVTYQDCLLFDSKCFVTLGRDAHTKIEFEYEGEKLFFNMIFVKDESKQQKHKFTVPDSQTINATFTNWENSLGMGFKEPLEIGDIGGRRFFLALWVKKAGDKSHCHEVTVSAYVGAEVAHGKN